MLSLSITISHGKITPFKILECVTNSKRSATLMQNYPQVPFVHIAKHHSVQYEDHYSSTLGGCRNKGSHVNAEPSQAPR